MTSMTYRPEELLDSMADGFLAMDVEGYLIYSNTAAEQFLGRSRERLLGRYVWEVLPESVGLLFFWHFHRAVSEEQPVDFEAYHQTEERWLEIRLSPLRSGGVVASLRDIARHKALEDELRKSESRLRNAFEQAAVGLADVGLDGRLLRVNDRLCAILGRNRQSLLGLPVRDISHPDDIATDLEHAAQLVEGHAAAYQMEKRFLRPDGSVVWGNLTVALVRDTSGAPHYFISALEDITERKHLEQQRIDILRTVVHDLNSPLAVARLSVETYRRRMRRSPLNASTAFAPSEDWFETLTIALTRMQRLVSDLATVTRLESGRMLLRKREMDLRALCQREARLFQSISDRALEAILPEQPVPVEGDEEALGRVVNNLLTNADKYTQGKAPVVLTLATDANGWARVTVRDEGMGISAEDQEHIWEQFRRGSGVPDVVDGLGLGLAICKALIEQHGGKIGVSSTIGQGSTFWFTLPRATTSREPPDERADIIHTHDGHSPSRSDG